MKRVFLIVLDSCGIGELPDAAAYGDMGSFTLRSAGQAEGFSMPNMAKLGLFQIAGVREAFSDRYPADRPYLGTVARIAERSKGKDTTTGHWEIAGAVSEQAMPTFPDGFPEELLQQLERETGRGILCNKPYSGTDVIRDYGKEQLATGKLIVYTSADSVLQIAAHDALIPTEELYRYCEIARRLCTGPYAVGRVIARPFTGEWPYTRTKLRHDYSLVPPKTMLNALQEAGYAVRSVGKIVDIFAGSGITHAVRTKDNADGMAVLEKEMQEDFTGLCFVNLVDFDMLYGHRNDVQGYGDALSAFDQRLGNILSQLSEEDVLMITADHGCDPATPSTDHSREYIPFVAYGKPVNAGVNLGDRACFADIAQTILAYFGVDGSDLAGTAMNLFQ